MESPKNRLGAPRSDKQSRSAENKKKTFNLPAKTQAQEEEDMAARTLRSQ